MHLAVATGFFLAMIAFFWERLKQVFGKTAATSSKGILVVVEKESAQGDKIRVVVQLSQGPSATLLEQLPGAIWGDCPTAPQVPANPEPLPPLLPAHKALRFERVAITIGEIRKASQKAPHAVLTEDRLRVQAVSGCG